MNETRRERCPECSALIAVRPDGTLRRHQRAEPGRLQQVPCKGGGKPAVKP